MGKTRRLDSDIDETKKPTFSRHYDKRRQDNEPEPDQPDKDAPRIS